MSRRRNVSSMRRSDGFLLVTVLVTSLLLLLLIVGAAFTSLVDRQSAAEQREGTEAYYVAKAGIEQFKVAALWALAEADMDWSGDPTESCGLPIGDGIDFGDALTLLPSTLSVTNVATFALGDEGATYDLSFELAGPLMLLRSVGRVNDAQSTVQVIAAVGDGPATVWDNAITAGTLEPGSAGGLAGTISVYGPVHILAGDATVDADVDLTGNAGIFNNYMGKGPTSPTYAQDVANALFATDALRYQDLCTTVKMEVGNLEVGNLNTAAGTRIGAEADHEGITSSIWGIFLDFASGEHAVTSKGDPIDPMSEPYVFVRNPVSDYDPFDYQDLPSFAEAAYPPSAIDGVPVRTVSDPATCPWLDGGTLTLPPADPSVACLADDGTPVLAWSGDTLVVSPTGPTYLSFPTADLAVESDVTYEGLLAMWFGDSTYSAAVTVEGNLAPASNDYLTTSALGLTSSGTIDVSSAKGDVVAAMLFAQDTISVERQVTIVGSLFGTNVNLKNVPRILHNRAVPEAAAILGMPGSESVQATGIFQVLSEERR